MQCFFACLFFSVLTISSPPAEAAWWSAATAAYGRELSYEPGHTIVRIEELDADGMVQSTESGELRTHRAGGKLVSTVIQAQKNGKDVTADWQKRYNRSSSEGSVRRAGESVPRAGVLHGYRAFGHHAAVDEEFQQHTFVHLA